MVAGAKKGDFCNLRMTVISDFPAIYFYWDPHQKQVDHQISYLIAPVNSKCPWRKRNHEGAAGALWCGLSEFFDISGYDLKKIVEYLGASVCKVIFSNVFHILL